MSVPLSAYAPLSVEDCDRLVELARRFVRSWESSDVKEKRNARAAFDRFRKAKSVDPLHALRMHVAAVEVAKQLEKRGAP